MKRKSLRTLVCALLASLALTTFAFADNGPKPQLIVRVKNAPQEPYYLDLLAKGDWDAEDGNRIDGIDWNYDGKEDTLDPDLLALLRDNVPAGWHACVAQGTTGAPMWGELYAEGTDASGNALHWFGYVGVPSTYRIILVTESGKVWVSDILNRRVLQSSVTVNWSDDTSAVTVSVPSTIPGYLLQFVATPVICSTAFASTADASHRGRAAASVPLFVEEKLGNVFTCQRSDTGLFSRCICICHRTQRRERLVSLFLPASGGTHHFACRAVSLRRLRPSHWPQQGPRRGLCDHRQSGFRCSRLLSGRACLAARCLDLMILFT